MAGWRELLKFIHDNSKTTHTKELKTHFNMIQGNVSKALKTISSYGYIKKEGNKLAGYSITEKGKEKVNHWKVINLDVTKKIKSPFCVECTTQKWQERSGCANKLRHKNNL